MKNKLIMFVALMTVLAIPLVTPASASAQGNTHLPSGIQHAPGIEKRIENGKGLPSGIKKFIEKFDKKGDKNKEDIRNIRVVSASTTATVAFNTNVNTTAEVRYSSVSPVTTTNSSVAVDSTMSMRHSIVIPGLNADTTYFYTVSVKDADGNVKTQDGLSFHTKVTDVIVPKIIFNSAFNIKGNSADVVWITNERADSRVWVGTTSTVDVTGTPAASSATLSYFHNLKVSNLATSTQYFYAITSTDNAGNVSVTGTGSFTTTAQ